MTGRSPRPSMPRPNAYSNPSTTRTHRDRLHRRRHRTSDHRPGVAALAAAARTAPVHRRARRGERLDLSRPVCDLDADLRRGTLSEAQYAEAKGEPRSVACSTKVVPSAKCRGALQRRVAQPPSSLQWPCRCSPGCSIRKLGSPEAFSPIATPVDSAHQLNPDQVNQMVEQLAARLQKEPDNVEGRVTLARTTTRCGASPKLQQPMKG